MIGWTWLAGALAVGAAAVQGQDPFQPRSPDSTSPAPGSGKYWRLLPDSSDEFDSSLSAVKWSRSFPGWAGNAPAAIDEDNAAVNTGDGSLEIAARLDPDHAFPDSDPSCGCTFETYTVGLARQLVALAPPVNGRLYIEVKAQAAPAMVRSNIWLQGPSAEISAFEIQGKLADGTAAETCETSYHVYNANATTESQFYSTAGVSTTGFSVFGILIDTTGSGSVTTTVDGGGATAHSWFGGHDLASAEFSLVMDVSINATVGLPADADLPAVFKIDHIRAYEEDVIETELPTVRPTSAPTPGPVTYCPEGYTDLAQRWNWGMGRITVTQSHQMCADRCTQFSGVQYNGGCKGYMTGMYHGMLLCKSYGGSQKGTNCAPWAQPDSNGYFSGTNTLGGNCCTRLASLESEAAGSSSAVLLAGSSAAGVVSASSSATYAIMAVGVASIAALATVAVRRSRAAADLAANTAVGTTAAEQMPLVSTPPATPSRASPSSPSLFTRYGTA